MKKWFWLIFLLYTIEITQSFGILGVWRLKQINDYPVISEHVQIVIEDIIFRQKQVQQVILFKGCRTYRYMSQIVQNNIFINFNTFNYVNETEIANCQRQISLMHSFIQEKIKSIFKFNIIGNNLVFLDAKKNKVMMFQRQINLKSLKSLKGNWNLFRMNSRKIQDKIYFTNSQIFLCQQKLKYSYNINGKYQIKTNLINNNGCISDELQQTISNIKYFRTNNKTLEMYDQKIKIRIQAIFLQDIPSDFNIQSNANIKDTKNVIQVSNNKLLGNWQPLSIFNTPLNSSSIKIIFTQNKVSFNGGCNKYIFQYNFDSVKNQINLGKRQSTQNVCQNDQDGLYINAMWKMTKYTINSNGILKLTDALGKPLYELKNMDQSLLIKSQTQPIKNSQQNIFINETIKLNTSKLINQTIKLDNSKTINLQNGRYVILLTNRRDLPRKFCNINSGKFICEGCNLIENNYRLINENKIQISGQIIGNKICSNNNDQIYLKTIGSFKLVQKSSSVQGYQFKDTNNQLVGYLSLS